MGRGISLHIGVNRCSPEHYAGWSGPLQGCEADCDDMLAIAKAQGFTPKILKTADATRETVMGAIGDGALALGLVSN